jgi:LSD1 subclass zinc finger protein
MRVGDCPSCRAPVEFRPGAGKIKVCEYCHTVVLRGELNLESVGKVADLVDTQSPLKLRLAGHYTGNDFTIVGRIQKTHGTGTWDEWCLSFDDGRTAWLSESEGEWNLMFPLEGIGVPDVGQLRPLSSFRLRDRTFVVEEVGTAQTVAAEGQLPDFNREHRYADATGPTGAFCSIDSADGGSGEAFIGTRVTIAQLGFDKAELAPTPKRDALKQARCTNCNGNLELKAPNAIKRVACPYCGALLDVSSGELAFLQLLEKPPYEPVLPLGSEGTLNKTKWTVLAFLIRSTTVEGTRYPWEEYLLWNQQAGFRWLMNSNGHWTFLTPIAAGDVAIATAVQKATWKGKSFKAYQSVFATTDYVAGECFWQVSVGEMARASEYVEPPESINTDETATEVTFTHGVMMSADEVKEAFRIRAPLPTAQGLAPAQLNPHKAKLGSQFTWAGIWSAVFCALLVVFSVLGDTRQFMRATFTVPSGVHSGTPEAQQFTDPFTLDKKTPLEVELEVPNLSNEWLAVQLDLVNEASGEVISVSPETSYYSGVDDGESWSEGSRTQTKQTAEVDPGTYVLRATPTFEAPSSEPRTYTVTVKGDSGVGLCCPFLVFLLLVAGPLATAWRSSSFETRRWNDAVIQSSPGVSTFPYAKQEDDE